MMSGKAFEKVAISSDSNYEALGKTGEQSSEIDEFFTKDELAKLSEYEKNRYRNIRRNYEMMVSVGLPARKPEFMEKPVRNSVKLRKQLKRQQDSDSDEEWTPASAYQRSTTKRDRKKVLPFSVPQIVASGKRKKTTNSVTEEETSLNWTKPRCHSTSDETKHPHRYPLRELPKQNYMDLEAPNDDDFIFCEDCDREHEGDCPIHGSYIIVNDAIVSNDCIDDERPFKTLPTGLVVKASGIPNAGLGVWAEDTIPVRTRFGPYLGETTQDADEAHSTGYSWQIYYHGKPKHFVNAYCMKNSNWMRFVNCARSENEQNLVAFQYQGQIYYRTYKEIKPGTELLVWYGYEYGKELGIIRKKLEIVPKFVNGVEIYKCPWCTVSLGTLDFLSKHCKYKHGQLVGVVSHKKYEEDDIYKCTKCDVSYSYIDFLVSHMKRAHKRIIHFDDLPNKKLIFSPAALARQMEQQRTCMENLSELPQIDMDQESKAERLEKNFVRSLGERMQESLEESNIEKNAESQITFDPPQWAMHITQRKHLRMHMGQELCNYSTAMLNNLKKHQREHLTKKKTRKKPYKCKVCWYSFAYLFDIQLHQRTHTGENPYDCDVCGYGAVDKHDLQKHQEIHTGENTCKFDVNGYNTAQLNHHKIFKERHTEEKPNRYDMCGYSAAQLNDLKKHRTNLGEKPYKCDMYGYSIARLDDFKRHQRTHTGEKPYKCDVCGYSTAQLNSIKIHQRTHTEEKPYECDVCGYSAALLQNLKTHQRTHTGEKPYKCGVCGYSTTQLNSLKRHQRTHTGEKPYKCDVCGYGTAQRCDLKKYQRKHTGEKPYKCDVCGYRNARLDVLKKHQRTHTGEKPYKCDVCGYSAAQLNDLKKHQRTHTGEKPYKCDVCGYSAALLQNIKTHQRTHTGEKPYKCDVCGYSTTHLNSLKRHQRTHTGEKPYKCDVCGYGTAQWSDLKIHQRTHTGEKPYKCDVCGYSAAQLNHLKTHQRTHTGEKPYKCDVCGYSAAQLNHLKTHQRTHT